MTECALVVVPLRAELLPQAAAPKIHALVLGSIDVASPKQPNIAMREGMLAGHAAEVKIHVVRSHQLEARPTLQMKGGRRGLVQLGLDIGQLTKRHGGVARLEENFAAVIAVVLVAIEDVLEIKAGHARHEQIGWLGAMFQTPEAIVAGAMVACGGIVTDDRCQIAQPKGRVRHRCSPYSLTRTTEDDCTDLSQMALSWASAPTPTFDSKSRRCHCEV